MTGMLNEQGLALQKRVRSFLEEMVETLRRRSDHAAVDDVEQAIWSCNQPFMLVVVGEYNAGKSALINALIGESLLDMDVTPTTDVITIVTSQQHDEPVSGQSDDMTVRWLHSDSPRLDSIAIVDTPGTNSLIDKHQLVTQNFIPRADQILFVSSCQQPMTASEREFLTLIHRQWRRKLLFVLNKRELLTEEELTKVRDYTKRHLKDLLLESVPLFAISARQALRSRLADDRPGVELSAIGELEHELFERLSEDDRWRIKLNTPLSAVDKLIADRLAITATHEKMLHDELGGIEAIESRAAESVTRIKELLEAYLPAIENPFLRFQQNCVRFIDQNITVTTLVKMKLTGRSLDREFHEQVFSDPLFRAEFDNALDAAKGFVVKELNRFHLDMLRSVNQNKQRFEAMKRDILGFQADEHMVSASGLQSLAEESYREFDGPAESARIQAAISKAITQFLGIEVFSGGVIAVFLTTAMSDLTGILMGTALAGLGLTILPRRRTRIKNDFAHRITEIADNVKIALERGLHREIDEALSREKARISPYVALCRNELKQTIQVKEELAALREELATLRAEASDLGSNRKKDAR